jgi:LysM repeat protein
MAAAAVATATLFTAVVTSAGVAHASTRPSTVTVHNGDTLSELAQALGVSQSSLAAANGINDTNHIETGQVLKVPAAGSGLSSAASRYTVRPGDNLTTIAARYHTTISAIATANKISNRHLILIGSTLTIPAASASSSGGGSGLPSRLLASPSRLELQPRFAHWAAVYGTPLSLLEGLTWLESGWQNDVVSSTGAMGIGQLMPDTVDLVNNVLLHTNLDPHVADDNIRMSARFLRYLLDQAGSTSLAVAAYYQGFKSIARSGQYPSTVTYVANVLYLRDRFANA